MADVTFNVNAGTYAGEILIEKFIGSGLLTINGANAAGQTTHNISRISIMFNSTRIIIQGFNATATTDYMFYVHSCSGYVRFIYCNSTAGINTTDGFYGVFVAESTWAIIQDCIISNKRHAIRVRSAKVNIVNLSGTNNATVYDAYIGGIIQKENAGSITGTTVSRHSSGGLIINPSGGTIGS